MGSCRLSVVPAPMAYCCQLLATFTLRPPPAPSLEIIYLVCPFVMLSSSTGIYPWLPFSLLSLQIYGVALLSDPGGSAASKLAKKGTF